MLSHAANEGDFVRLTFNFYYMRVHPPGNSDASTRDSLDYNNCLGHVPTE